MPMINRPAKFNCLNMLSFSGRGIFIFLLVIFIGCIGLTKLAISFSENPTSFMDIDPNSVYIPSLWRDNELPPGLLRSNPYFDPANAAWISFVRDLSDPTKFSSQMQYLYGKYGSEITSQRGVMRDWCRRVNSCKFCDLEIEMLYMLIREIKPKNVFECAPNKGYSTSWILHALKLNGVGNLTSVDIHSQCLNNVPSDPQWKFYQGDFEDVIHREALDLDDYEFIFVDALHTVEFAKRYISVLLQPRRHPTMVAIHDIVSAHIREGPEVFKFLALSRQPMASYAFTMNPQHTPLAPRDATATLNQERARAGIIRDCRTAAATNGAAAVPGIGACGDPTWDLLWTGSEEPGGSGFVGVDNPTIFFALNSV